MLKIQSLIVFFLFISFTINISAQDWANLSKYNDENKILLESKKQDKRIVFLGNSITESWKKLRPNFFKENNFVNRGIDGQTTPQMLLRFRQDIVNINTDIVIILAGTNDIAGNTGTSTLDMIQNNIASMCDIAKQNDIEIVLCSILPVHHYPWASEIKPIDKIKLLNDWVKNYSNKNNICFVDYYSSMVNDNGGMKSNLSEDRVHPNKEGYFIMEKIILEKLDELAGSELENKN